LSSSAKPTETVKSLFARLGIMETWHHVSQGRSIEEIQQIQDEARKRAEAVAAMERRAKEAEAPVEKQKVQRAEKPAETPAAVSEPAPEAVEQPQAPQEAVEAETPSTGAGEAPEAVAAEEPGSEDAPEKTE
jgi:hypothetical protein